MFKFDPDFAEHEARYQQIKRGILGESDDEEEGSGSGESDRYGVVCLRARVRLLPDEAMQRVNLHLLVCPQRTQQR